MVTLFTEMVECSRDLASLCPDHRKYYAQDANANAKVVAQLRLLVEYDTRMKLKYQAAARRPWLSVEPDPPEPPQPE
jgi:hypothetical protein